MVDLLRDELHASVTDPVAASMNFLNEIAGRYPDAISLAAGRPYEGFYRTEDIGRYLDIYAAHLGRRGAGAEAVRRTLMQYGRTNGFINDLVARLLEVDEGIRVAAGAVAITTGCQEAMVIVLRGLFRPGDVLLAAAPCYVGITGAARLLDIEVVPVPEGPAGLDPDDVLTVAREVRATGRRPRALYLVPDFANPSGSCLSVPRRQRLIEVAGAADLLLLEDDPYGLFGLDDTARPKLKALDRDHRVIYLGSFAKSCFPGPRVGFLVADQPVVDASGRRTLLADELSTVKSMLTVNTSAIAQAVIGGILVESGCSLRAANRDKISFYRRNLTSLLAALDRYFPAGTVTWNVPAGGFFAVLATPVRADIELLTTSAREYGVIWTPMSFFYTDGGGQHAIRLSCSSLPPDQVDEGVRRLAKLLTAHT
ncbi:MAG: (S)-3,5-dihydroxyphenylglycine transaminase [Micromonosporaceae bacterium]